MEVVLPKTPKPGSSYCCLAIKGGLCSGSGAKEVLQSLPGTPQKAEKHSEPPLAPPFFSSGASISGVLESLGHVVPTIRAGQAGQGGQG